jgi:hypothetical protein
MTKESEFYSRQDIFLFISVQICFRPMKFTYTLGTGKSFFLGHRGAGVKLTIQFYLVPR